jgi:hypothetical protein
MSLIYYKAERTKRSRRPHERGRREWEKFFSRKMFVSPRLLVRGACNI